MREIKFRGQIFNSHEWACGSLLKDETGRIFIGEYIEKKLEAETYCTGRGNGKSMRRFLGIGLLEVISETVGQFTGMLDKNGVEIYEGDILSIGEYGPFVVKFERACFECSGMDIHNAISLFDGKVIGNIHENPELLEKG